MFTISNFALVGSAGVWYAFANSDGMGKAIVFLLFVSSMITWAIMIEKWQTLYRALKLSERFMETFNSRHGMNSMLRDGMDNPCPVAKVYLSGMEQLLEFYGQTPEEASSGLNSTLHGPRKLSPAQLDAVQTALEREVSSQIFVIEERIGVLATSVSLSPFLGLFGTVWGVMLAFCGVASAGSANIQALAPGVAGALLTTVAGLLVAIPSLIGYNTLTQMIRKITVCMDNFSEAFMARLKLEQLTAREMPESQSDTPAAAVPAAQIPQNRPAVSREFAMNQTPPPVPAAQIPQNRPAFSREFAAAPQPAAQPVQQQPTQSPPPGNQYPTSQPSTGSGYPERVQSNFNTSTQSYTQSYTQPGDPNSNYQPPQTGAPANGSTQPSLSGMEHPGYNPNQQ